MPTLAVDIGTVTFNGKVVPDSYAVNVDGTSTNGIITFSNLSQTALGADRKVGDPQSFTIILTECDAAITNLSIRFDGTRVTDHDEGVSQPTGMATNLDVRMLPEGSSDYVRFDGSESDDSLNEANGESAVLNHKTEVIQVGSIVLTTNDCAIQATHTLIYH